jgi:methyl-accepting chemotaxis protein
MARNNNFRDKLLITIIPITIIAIVLLGLLNYIVARGAIVDGQLNNMEQIARKTTAEIDMWLDDRVRDVQMLAQFDFVKDACMEKELAAAQNKLVNLHKYSPVFEDMWVADATGVINIDAIAGQSVGNNLSKKAGFKINVDKAKENLVWVGDVQKSPATGKPIVLVSAPVSDNAGKVIGLMGTPVALSHFADLLISKFKIAETGYIYMVDSKGIVLAHPNKDNILKLDISKYDWGKKILAEKQGSFDYTFEGVSKIVSFGTAGKKDWIVCVTAPKSELFSSLNKIMYLSLICGLIVVGLIVAGLWMQTNKVFVVIKGVSYDLDTSSNQIDGAAGQIAGASQSLADGASRQAAAVEETSSSLEEMSSMTRQNADNANQANHLMSQTQQVVGRANDSMKDLTRAMGDISSASEQTSKIIKTIDEIAFQTNLLALNAAVEAARAGEAGAGFAVVAEEVRNLALRSAEAAKNTSNLIEDTVNKIRNGSEIVTKTNQDFNEVTVSAGKISELISEIAAASHEQAQGIEQISKTVTELDQIVQSNASSAEETASASEEMSAQSKAMKESVIELVSLVGGEHLAEKISSAPSLSAGTKPAQQQKTAVPKKSLPAPSKDF